MKALELARPVALVSGANRGIGLECAAQLAGEHGYHVILACRNDEACREAAHLIRERHPSASVECRHLDLANLSSVVRLACDELKDRAINCFVSNAGVLAVPDKTLTKDGLELTFQCNHLAPFLLTNLLLPHLRAGAAVGFPRSGTQLPQQQPSRVVLVSSTQHRNGRFDWDNLNSEQSYGKWAVYANTKLYQTASAQLFQTTVGQDGRVEFVTVRPGLVNTNIQRNSKLLSWLYPALEWVPGVMTSPAEAGRALVYAATERDAVSGGDYMNLLKRAECSSSARDAQNQQRLWDTSVAMLADKGFSF